MSDFGLGDEAIESLFLQLDTNSDGEIDLSEFLAGWDAFASASAPPHLRPRRSTSWRWTRP